MTTVREIIEYTRKLRGKEGRFRISMLGMEGANVGGLCSSVGYVVDTYKGSEWRSNLAVGHPKQKYPGHNVGVIRTRGKAGVVVDFTSDDIVVGQVGNVKNEVEIRKTLKSIYGVDGWKKLERLSDKELKEEYGL